MAKRHSTGAAVLDAPSASAEEVIDTRIGKLAFESGYPSQDTVSELYDEMDFQRACQAYIWGIPAVGLAKWRVAHRDVMKGKQGEMLSYLDFEEKLGILTPNFTTPYIATFSDLQETGPFMVELPPGLMAGMIMNPWQRVLADRTILAQMDLTTSTAISPKRSGIVLPGSKRTLSKWCKRTAFRSIWIRGETRNALHLYERMAKSRCFWCRSLERRPATRSRYARFQS